MSLDFSQWVSIVSDWIWGPPMLILLLGGGLFLTFRLGFFQIRFFGHAMAQTVGTLFKKKKREEGTLTPFQAFSSALACTAGATNIVGVPLAIYMGGPGALFWMWVVAVIGMATKYGEIILGIKYREKNDQGEWVGGPMYYIRKGLGWKPLAALFAFAMMLEVIPSSMVQSNSISTTVESAFGWSTGVTGFVIMVLTAIVVLGGVKRIGRVAEQLVPFMVLGYMLAAGMILLVYMDQLPAVFALIFEHAFTPISAVGGFSGAAVASAIRWGMARGAYSNEAGVGTAAIAHATAQTDHPARQGLWGIFAVFMDTIVICTLSGLVVLASGAWTQVGVDGSPADLVPMAFGSVFGDTLGGAMVAVFLLIFALTTVGVLIYYGEKQAEYLFGLGFSKVMRIVYILSIYVGAIGGLQFIWQFLDIILAMVVLPNMIALLMLNKVIKAEIRDYLDNVYALEKQSRKAS
ncbi:sodium:alanine symporter family protein [Kroppenstedtia pulmonis]|uniref:Sodium:alanine symporter family protein n=2 Tax=Kroppenstedtia pulmonis TaxID=1380685 RepID=A0A7D4C994_9BACL|nr:sodium:alanine symporter family protein [Kroppenstedtia pulmonis]